MKGFTLGGRSKAPPWVRWAGEELVALGLQARRELDALELSLATADRLDTTTLRRLQSLRALVDEAVNGGKDLQHAPTDPQLVEWALGDEAFLAVLVNELEGR